MASSHTIERSGRADWTLMTAIHHPPADSAELVAVVGQRLLVATCLLDADQFGPSERMAVAAVCGAARGAARVGARAADRRRASHLVV